MIPSKYFRLIISKNHKLKLERYSWNKELQKKIFNIDFYDSHKKMKLRTIFLNGYNIGNCLLTSYYVSTIFENSLICTGKVEILKGTKNSPNGDHVWIETEDEIIDTTLMIILPKYDIYASFYHKEFDIKPLFSSEELSYENTIHEKKTNTEKYFYDLYKIE